MLLDATQRYDDPLTAERLFDWHAVLFPTGRSGMKRITVGAQRTDESGPMQVVSGPIGKERVHFEAPAAECLEVEMQRFLEWFNDSSEVDPILRAAIAHLWFVTIHPFDDGNGRIARATMPMTHFRVYSIKQNSGSTSTRIPLTNGSGISLTDCSMILKNTLRLRSTSGSPSVQQIRH